MLAGLSLTAVGLGIGIALAATPGPVQAVLLTEAVRGGVARGFRALAGVHLAFGALLVALALGLAVASPHGLALQLLKVAGGLWLLWLAAEGLRSHRNAGPAGQAEPAATGRLQFPSAARGAVVMLLNPGVWLFVGAVASPLLATATERGGTGSALLAAGGLVAGAALGDCAVVLPGGRLARPVHLALTVVLAVLGLWLLLTGAGM